MSNVHPLVTLAPSPIDLVEIAIHGSCLTSDNPKDVDAVWRNVSATRDGWATVHDAPLVNRSTEPRDGRWYEWHIRPDWSWRAYSGDDGVVEFVRTKVQEWAVANGFGNLPMDIQRCDYVPAVEASAPFKVIKDARVPTGAGINVPDSAFRVQAITINADGLRVDPGSGTTPGEWHLGAHYSPYSAQVLNTTAAKIRRGEWIDGPIAIDLNPQQCGGYEGEGIESITSALKKGDGPLCEPLRWLKHELMSGRRPCDEFVELAERRSSGGRAVMVLDGSIVRFHYSDMKMPREAIFDDKTLRLVCTAHMPGSDFWQMVNSYESAVAASATHEPVECSFGHKSAVGIFNLDHHGVLSDLPPVCTRAPVGGLARVALNGVAVTGYPDFDAVAAVAKLLGYVVPDAICDLIATMDSDGPHAVDLTEGVGWRLLRARVDTRDRNEAHVSKWCRALKGFIDAICLDTPDFQAEDAMRREMERREIGELLIAGAEIRDVNGVNVALVDARFAPHGNQFDIFYKCADVVVVATPTGRVTIGARDVVVASAFGEDGLLSVDFGYGWGGRPTIVGSPRGKVVGLDEARDAFDALTR